MTIFVLMIAYALGCCALAVNQEWARRLRQGLRPHWGIDYLPEILLAAGVFTAFVGGANL